MRQIEPVLKTIGENNFYIRPFPAFKAANMTGELFNLIAPIISPFIPMLTSSKSGIADTELNASAIVGAFNSLSGDKVEFLLKRLLTDYNNIAVDVPDSKKAQVLTTDLANEVFCGEAQDMFILAFHVITINFNGFFEKLGLPSGFLNTIFTKMEQPS